MMVFIETLMEVALFIAIVFLAVTVIGASRNENSYRWWLARLMAEATFIAIELVIFNIRIFNGSDYYFTNLFLACGWLLVLLIDLINRKKR